jgi:hypothetical protein
MNINSLITYCKYCLVDRYKVRFSKKCPCKEEIVTAILDKALDKELLVGVSDLTVFQLFFDLEAKEYSNLSYEEKRRVKKKNKPKKGVYKELLGEGSCVIPKPESRKTQVFSRYINPHTIDISTLPF